MLARGHRPRRSRQHARARALKHAPRFCSAASNAGASFEARLLKRSRAPQDEGVGELQNARATANASAVLAKLPSAHKPPTDRSACPGDAAMRTGVTSATSFYSLTHRARAGPG